MQAVDACRRRRVDAVTKCVCGNTMGSRNRISQILMGPSLQAPISTCTSLYDMERIVPGVA
eukprot:6173348-Pleurochrysis_carterae.AAC.4